MPEQSSPNHSSAPPEAYGWQDVANEMGAWPEGLRDHARHHLALNGIAAPEIEVVAPIAETVVARLDKEAIFDESGLERSQFRIGGRKIVFRNRQETPSFADTAWYVVAADAAPPLPLELAATHEPMDTSAIDTYNERYSASERNAPDALMVVTNTPAGLVAAARALVTNPDRIAELDHLSVRLGSEDYTDPAVTQSIDKILAAISVDDDGAPSRFYATDGFAVALADLVGDKDAAQVLGQKLAALHRNEAQRKASIRSSHSELARRWRAEGVEPMPLENLALVHSTHQEIERDSEGNIVLVSAGQKRPDKVPRASVHFTVNSQVASNSGGEWDVDNRMIVANLAETAAASHKLPEYLYGVDTWFVTGPGEKLTLPRALVVESASAGYLIQDSVNGISFLNQETYTAEQQANIDKFAKQYRLERDTGMSPCEVLKEVALRRAMLRVGARLEELDMPSWKEHGMGSDELAKRINLTAAELGVNFGTHVNTGEAWQEDDCSTAIGHAYVEAIPRSVQYQGQFTCGAETSLEMRRLVLVNGYTPSRPNTLTYSAS